jgi:hypothetical protein
MVALGSYRDRSFENIFVGHVSWLYGPILTRILE